MSCTSANQSTVSRTRERLVRRAMPAGFQNAADASSATATKEDPIAVARAPIPIFRNCAPIVPTFSNSRAPRAVPELKTSNAAAPAPNRTHPLAINPPSTPQSEDTTAGLGYGSAKWSQPCVAAARRRPWRSSSRTSPGAPAMTSPIGQRATSETQRSARTALSAASGAVVKASS